MTRAQFLVLAVLAIMVCIVFGAAVVVVRAQLASISGTPVVGRPPPDVPGTLGPTATWTIIPTNTFSPTPVESLTPTPTNTRVVLDTPTYTPTSTPTITPTPTQTGTPTPARGRPGGGSPGGPRPAPTATSRYPLIVAQEPLSYTTKNYIFVVLAKVTSGNTLLPGYRMVGVHRPSGAEIKSPPSCAKVCKGSGPDKDLWPIQEGNLAFEAFFYDTGTWSLWLVDAQGNQASEVIQIPIDIKKRLWYYYQFNR
jgi:hypothetical protein